MSPEDKAKMAYFEPGQALGSDGLTADQWALERDAAIEAARAQAYERGLQAGLRMAAAHLDRLSELLRAMGHRGEP